MPPPLYCWTHDACKIQTQVIRDVKDIDTPPTEEEKECKCDPKTWRRVICATIFKRGENWGGGKGNW